jgi:hypothetical protein
MPVVLAQSLDAISEKVSDLANTGLRSLPLIGRADAKSALDDAGMTIPWPVRTVVLDTPVTIERNGTGGL